MAERIYDKLPSEQYKPEPTIESPVTRDLYALSSYSSLQSVRQSAGCSNGPVNPIWESFLLAFGELSIPNQSKVNLSSAEQEEGNNNRR